MPVADFTAMEVLKSEEAIQALAKAMGKGEKAQISVKGWEESQLRVALREAGLWIKEMKPEKDIYNIVVERTE